MKNRLHKDKNQQTAAADSPHYQQEDIASAFPPPFRLTAEPVTLKKEDKEEKKMALQKKEISEVAPAANKNEHILTTLQRKHNAYRSPAKEYTPMFSLPGKKQFKHSKILLMRRRKWIHLC